MRVPFLKMFSRSVIIEALFERLVSGKWLECHRGAVYVPTAIKQNENSDSFLQLMRKQCYEST